MEQARNFLYGINRKKDALKKAKSEKIKKDLKKSIFRDERELDYYCKYKGIKKGEL